MNEDVLDRLASYRPTTETVAREWGAASRTQARLTLFDEPPHGLTFRPAGPPRRLRLLAPLAASVAVLGVIAGAVYAANRLGANGGGSHEAMSGGNPTHFAQLTLSNDSGVGAHQFAERSVRSVEVRDDGTTTTALQGRVTDYVAPNGDIVSLRPDETPSCYVFAHSTTTTFQTADADFVAALSTDPAQLRDYFLAHVSGSASIDEAVFVAVGDMLRDFDLYASPRLRAALVDMLSESHVITVHTGDRDYLGRPAIRVDYSDQQRRAGELNSLYFDPATFQLLEERSGSNGLPSNEPSTLPYSATPSAGPGTPFTLNGTATITVVTSEKAVDSVPTLPANCDGGSASPSK